MFSDIGTLLKPYGFLETSTFKSLTEVTNFIIYLYLYQLNLSTISNLKPVHLVSMQGLPEGVDGKISVQL